MLLGDAAPDRVYAEIAVTGENGTRWYSSDQLPPDGRKVFREFAAQRSRWGAFHAPRDVAGWIFRVEPQAEEIRIDLLDERPEGWVGSQAAGREPSYEYRRAEFSVS